MYFTLCKSPFPLTIVLIQYRSFETELIFTRNVLRGLVQNRGKNHLGFESDSLRFIASVVLIIDDRIIIVIAVIAIFTYRNSFISGLLYCCISKVLYKVRESFNMRTTLTSQYA